VRARARAVRLPSPPADRASLQDQSRKFSRAKAELDVQMHGFAAEAAALTVVRTR